MLGSCEIICPIMYVPPYNASGFNGMGPKTPTLLNGLLFQEILTIL
jgi:hypothetical protein